MASQPVRHPYLLAIRSDAGDVFEHPLAIGEVRIGRSLDCGIRLVDEAISRHHALVRRQGDEVFFEDLASRNGSLVNGRPVRTLVRLRAGDVIRVGGAEIELRRATSVRLEGEAMKPMSATAVMLDATHIPGETTRRLFADIADENRALTLLTRAGSLLISHRPLPETLDAILDLCLVGFGADRAAVALLASETAEPTVAAAKGKGGATDLRVSRAVARAVVAERKALAVTDIEGDPRIASSESVRIQGVHSLACAPLWDGTRVSGLLYVDRRMGRGDYTTNDVKVLSLLANVVAVRIENARLLDESMARERLEEELNVARTIQQGLMPAGAARVTGVDVHGTCRPCTEIGGDLFDFFPLPSGRLALIVADVCGKGVSGALVAASLQAALRGGAHVDVSPSQRMAWLDEHVARHARAAGYVTAAYVEVDPATGELACSRAGHPTPLILRVDGRVEALAAGGLPLGLAPGAPHLEQRARLGPGDRLVLTTDGVLEASPGGAREPSFGEGRLIEAVRSASGAAESCDGVFDALERFTAGAPLRDDATVVVLVHGVQAPVRVQEDITGSQRRKD